MTVQSKGRPVSTWLSSTDAETGTRSLELSPEPLELELVVRIKGSP